MDEVTRNISCVLNVWYVDNAVISESHYSCDKTSKPSIMVSVMLVLSHLGHNGNIRY